jgi:hypothetical protein
MFTVDVARNFVAPEVTVGAGLDLIVDERVSTVLAVAYVEVYSVKMSRNGREKIKRCGRVSAGRSEDKRQVLNAALVAAFVTIDLSFGVS